MIIVNYPVNQLGNALRSVLSTKILADAASAKFVVDFTKGRCSLITERMLRALLPNYVSATTSVIRELPEQQCMRWIKLFGTNSDPVLEAIFNPVNSFPKEGFGLSHIYSAKPDCMTVEYYLRAKHAEYGRMSFPEILKDAVRQFRHSWDIADVIGMHIRYSDNLADSVKATLNTNVSVFENKLRTIIATHERVLLCTDNKKIRDYLVSIYPKSIILPNSINTDFQALYEMMLLAETKCVLGSYASTFSYEACLFKGTDLEVFENGVWKRYEFSFLRELSTDQSITLRPVTFSPQARSFCVRSDRRLATQQPKSDSQQRK
jgi:hypothetical protein